MTSLIKESLDVPISLSSTECPWNFGLKVDRGGIGGVSLRGGEGGGGDREEMRELELPQGIREIVSAKARRYTTVSALECQN